MCADEGLRDVVDAEPEGEVEIGEVLFRERRDRKRDAGDVHTLVRLDHAARDHLAQRSSALDSLDPQADMAVVDEDLVAGLEHRCQDVGRDREPVRRARLCAGDDDRLAGLELGRRVEVSDPDLRALEISDERERSSRGSLNGPGTLRAQLVVVVSSRARS